MRIAGKIVLFSILGLFVFGIIAGVSILILVPAGDLPDIKVELPAPAEKTEKSSEPVPIEREYEKMSQQAIYQLQPSDLINAYNTDTDTADAKYVSKIVRLRGIIRDIEVVSGFHIVLLTSNNISDYVRCRIKLRYEASLKDVKKGQDVFVVGFVEGKKEQVTLFNCILAPTQ